MGTRERGSKPNARGLGPIGLGGRAWDAHALHPFIKIPHTVSKKQ